MTQLYDEIGDDYDVTRKADRQIVTGLAEALKINSSGRYLDVACGTGNYTAALSDLGGTWAAIDHSEVMLRKAQKKTDQIQWCLNNVSALSFDSNVFDGASCVLAIHHFANLTTAFSEIARVLADSSRLVIFTATPEQMQGYWLNQYFPAMMEQSCRQMPTFDSVRDALVSAGFFIEHSRPFFVTPALEDFFLYSGKQRPEIYLYEQVRNGISSFQNLCSEKELRQGLRQLTTDIESSDIQHVIQRFDNNRGDYCFIVATKR